MDGFDAAMREMGVGDASIARKVRGLAEHYYGLGGAVVTALEGDAAALEGALEEILCRNGVAGPEGSAALAAHFAALAGRFREQGSDAFLEGNAPWEPYPATSRPSVAKASGAS
ncbi:MAG: ubiquinol-cytochrome C chaperone family protein [Hyphomonas sp.]